MVNTGLILLGLVSLPQPIEVALTAADTPITLRAAFDVELRSEAAVRVFSYDPRLPAETAWQLKFAEGEDAYLDEFAAHWGAERAPDGRLAPDDLRASLGQDMKIEDFGDAWRLGFAHIPSANDRELDLWIGARVEATAWLSPDLGQFLRIDYHLPKPVRGPEGGRILTYEQSYFLEPDPVYNLSMVSAFSLSFSARAAFKTVRQSYSMRVLKLEVFFATPEDEAAFLQARAQRRIGAPAGIP
jgi:hypothetical protein